MRGRTTASGRLSHVMATPPCDWREQARQRALNRQRRSCGHQEVLRLGEEERPVQEPAAAPRHAVVPEASLLGPAEVGRQNVVAYSIPGR